MFTIKKSMLCCAWLSGLIFSQAASAQATLLQAPSARVVPDKYIVVLKENNLQYQTLGTSYVTQMANDFKVMTQGTIEAEFNHALKGFAIATDDSGVNWLLAQDEVDYIEPVQRISLTAQQNNAPWGLDRLDQQNQPLNSVYRYDLTGAGVNAYVIDTGINTSHSQFSGRIGQVVTTIGNDAQDCNGHGTHVAGTIGASTYGVAKQVRLHSVKVFGCSGETTSTAIVQGIDWVAANAVLPAVANMSLGGGVSAALDQATNRLIQRGVSTVVAAGNDNTNACNISPARVAAAITVGSTTRTDARSSFSNWGSCVNIFAPGSDILSTWIGGSSASRTISGTSMASPHVAGVSALYLQQYPNATPAQVAQAIYTNAASGKISGTNGTVNLLANTEFLFGGDGGDNQPPVASFSHSINGLTVSLQDTSTDDQGVVSRSWNFGDGNGSAAENPIHSYAQAGSYTVSLTVADQQGLQSTASRSITVSSGGDGGSCNGVAAWSASTSYQAGNRVVYNQRVYEATWWSTGARPDVFSNVWRDTGPCDGGGNAAPVANFSFAANGLAVQFTDLSTDDQAVVSWQWNFGDGRTATAQHPQNNYSQAGSYDVSLTVTDADGASNVSSKTVTVSAEDNGCGGLAAWNSAAVYLKDDQVSYQNVRYRANWWTQNNNPAQNSGPWAVWTNLGNCN
ncbi:S8 family serine peptidase [Rheinheimera muenzenbergensis]|uniref:S8 family serine peptidase n=1 Tax=Rheinheimera muenzenbergensis TaxID=1193628 RepID=A0ABU8C8W1_9GAMM